MEDKLDEKVLRYRRHHPKCDYCKYLRLDGDEWLGIWFHKCLAKDKIIEGLGLIVPRHFCSCYEVEENF